MKPPIVVVLEALPVSGSPQTSSGERAMSLGANHFQSFLTPFVSFEHSLLGAVVFASDVPLPLRFFGGGVGNDDDEAGAMKKPDVSDDADWVRWKQDSQH